MPVKYTAATQMTAFLKTLLRHSLPGSEHNDCPVFIYIPWTQEKTTTVLWRKDIPLVYHWYHVHRTLGTPLRNVVENLSSWLLRWMTFGRFPGRLTETIFCIGPLGSMDYHSQFGEILRWCPRQIWSQQEPRAWEKSSPKKRTNGWYVHTKCIKW